jgi:hypothetical protein
VRAVLELDVHAGAELGDIDLRQVGAEVGQPGVDARVGREGGRAGCDIERMPATPGR